MLLRLFPKDRDGERDQKGTNCSVGLAVRTTIVVLEPKVDARHASAHWEFFSRWFALPYHSGSESLIGI